MPTARAKQRRYRKNNPKYRNKLRKKNYDTTGGPVLNWNHREEWTTFDFHLLEQWSGTDRELHKLIGRSVQAIQAMRFKLKDGQI